MFVYTNEVFCSDQVDSLYLGFQNPPTSARPRTWWHWTKGNVTLDGIKKDLEWMRRVGIAGFQLAYVNFGGGQTVDNKIYFGSDEWYDAVKYAAEEAERLELEMSIFSSPGWSITGGPWVKPGQAMKKLVWSDTLLNGAQIFKGELPHPPFNNGPFQDFGSGGKTKQNPDPTFYKDIAVFAYKVPESAVEMASLKPKVETSGERIDEKILFDGKYNSTVTIQADTTSGIAWIQYEFQKPFTAQAFTISGGNGIPTGKLLASNDGKNFTTLVSLPGAQLYRQGWVRTFSITETSAKYFRIELTGAPLNPAETMEQNSNKKAKEYVLREAVLHSNAKINRWEEKAGFRLLFEYESVPTPEVPENHTIQKKDLINLTSKLDNNGNLTWEIPEGKWDILRIGYSLTGAKNRPAVPSGLGYEVDKLSKEYTEEYIKEYLSPIQRGLGSLYGKSFRYITMDSWEAGMQNWTDYMIDEFQKRRGYDPTPYLPALFGRIVISSEVSDRFLWDFRRTLADMFAENHYGVISKYLKKEGIGIYGEASGVSLEILEDALLCKKFMEIPMGEFWVKPLHPKQMYFEDIRGAASAAHAYGKNITAAEAFTGGGFESPFTLKKIADYWFCQGINRLVFHTSAHQPLDDKPGNVMVGTHLNRNITWAEEAKPFIDYLSRTSYLLQKGKFVADVAYLLNEGAPSTMPIWGEGLVPKPPAGYDYDYINTDVLINRVSVDKKGNLILPDSMKYRILVLPQIQEMTLPVIKKIEFLVKNGAAVIGPKPIKSPSLTGFPEADLKVQEIADNVWGDLDGISRNHKSYGEGNVFWGWSIEKVLSFLNIPKDLESSKSLDMDLQWIHRSTPDNEIYFIVNDSEKKQDLEIRFRVTSKVPELWFSDSGKREPVEFIDDNKFTTVNVSLPEFGSTFVVFKCYDGKTESTVPKNTVSTIDTLNGIWDVRFPKNLGAPESIKLNKLQLWTNYSDSGIKYFSGTASYTKIFTIPGSYLQHGNKLILDLGKVGDIADVYVNKSPIGIRWKSPYAFDVTDLLRKGENFLNIEITNQWTNRIIGDSKLDENKKVLNEKKDAFYFFGPPPSLEESGLIGPVTIKVVSNSH